MPALPRLAPILFYGLSDDFGEFSNFAPYPINVRGKRWPTSEHFFQAQKFEDAKVREAIRRVKSPMGGDGSGANMLGRLLMELRARLVADE